MSHYFRGQVAELTGISIETLRFYENKGLIPAPQRTDAGYRIYTDDVLPRIAFILRAKHAGFRLEEIRQLLLVIDSKEITPDYPSEVLNNKLLQIDRQIKALSETRDFLAKVKGNIGNQKSCPILTAMLGDEWKAGK